MFLNLLCHFIIGSLHTYIVHKRIICPRYNFALFYSHTSKREVTIKLNKIIGYNEESKSTLYVNQLLTIWWFLEKLFLMNQLLGDVKWIKHHRQILLKHHPIKENSILAGRRQERNNSSILCQICRSNKLRILNLGLNFGSILNTRVEKRP